MFPEGTDNKASEGQVTRKETDNTEAYDAFLKGWKYFLHFTPDDLPKAILYLKRTIELDPNYTDPQNGWVQEVFDIMEPFLNERPEPRGAAYFTDASIFTPALGNPPTIILGPGEPTMAHKTNEFCYISRIEDATEAYFEIAKRWCAA